ncbi:hypothetical protein Glove_139g65 [Diversispora epigaea]|uniref:Retrotransposon gag domain-containing protein n=1 Tax=Diversispora epigaea TaxID=1348612 RepID=A0A397IZI4_9GLOM|nr:hypothetical protein Glove_139g65 [Diversispora epigaea]
MTSLSQIEELNRTITEVAALYQQKIRDIVNQTPDNQDPVWKLSDLEELRRIHEQLKLLFQIRDNCVKIIQDLEQLQNMDQRNRINRESQHQRSYSQPEVQRPTSPRIRSRYSVYQQTSNRPSLNLSLPQYTTPLTVRSGNLLPVESVSSRTRTPPTPTFFNRPEERSPSPLENIRQFQRDYLTGIDPYNPDEETTYQYQPIAGSSRPNPNQNLIDFGEQIIVNYSQHNSQEEQQEEQEEEQDNQNNNPLLQYYNPNINNNTQEPEEDNPSGGSSSEHTNNSDIQEESEEEMAFVVKPPKFSGVHNEDPKEWLEDFVMACHANNWNEDRTKNAFGAYLRKGAREWYLEWYEANDGADWPTTRDAFSAKYCNDAFKEQWLDELRGLKQRKGESTMEYGGAACVMYGCCGEGAFLFFFCRDPSDTSLPFPERNFLAIGWVVCLFADPSATFSLFVLVFNK